MPDELFPTLDTTEEEVGIDFSSLILDTNVSGVGAEFTFKSERNWTDPSSAHVSGVKQFEKYFNLDVDRLAQTIETIPFHERFSNLVPQEIVSLDRQFVESWLAEANDRKRELVVKDGSSMEDEKPLVTRKIEPKVNNKEHPRPMIPIKQPTAKLPAVPQGEDIQNWLDDILEL